MLFMDDMMVYPGTLMDDECGMRVIKCYIYKFAKERIERKQQYDVNLKRKTEKRFFWFHTVRPIWTRFHILDNQLAVKDFITLHQGVENKIVYFMPQYLPEDMQFHKRKSLVYYAPIEAVIEYFKGWGESDLQNITIIDTHFRWFYDVFEDAVKNSESNMDVVAYYYSKPVPRT